jgi:alpha-mannosidase
LLNLIAKSSGRDAVDPDDEANCFQLFDDRPTAWDAWDVDPYHLETKRDCGPATKFEIVHDDPLRAEVAFEYTIGKGSSLRQVARLDANSPRLEFHCTCDWHEDQKFLKVAFPLNVRAMNATYEMQFGCVERPTHFNTSYDLARFEVPGHKWADLSEHGFGVALLSESKYGFSTFGNTMRLSLLRAPTYPDPKADRGQHEFAFALMPHAGNWRDAGVVAESYRFNVPLLFARGSVPPRSFASVDDPNLVIETIKKAEDSNALVLRLYECHGARGTAKLRLDLPAKSAQFCNLLEDKLAPAKIAKDGTIEVRYTPFQIISLMIG